MVHYKTVVKSIAAQNGLFASFMPKPLPNEHGSALSISISLKKGGDNIFGNDINTMPHEGKCFISGVLSRIREITAFLNCTTNSYKRFGIGYAPKYVNWSADNCAQLIRVPKPVGITPRMEIRSADACCNPYITFKLILAAGIGGIQRNDSSLFESAMHSNTADSVFQPLPSTLEEAAAAAKASDFVKQTLSPEILSSIFAQLDKQIYDYDLAKDKDKFEEESYFKFV
jgi:glutamine synthetase